MEQKLDNVKVDDLTEENSVTSTDDSVQESMQIEVVYGTPKEQVILLVAVDIGCTVEEVIKISGVLTSFIEIDLTMNKVGIWNRTAKLTDVVKDLDRIEIYRPLIADPKEVRKRRADKAKEEGRADKVTGGRVDPRRAKSE